MGMASTASWVAQINQSPSPPFFKKVWKVMLKIPKGKVSTYGGIAKRIGSPLASRAIGNACNANPFAPHVPCHRVVSASGGIGGYAFGVSKKIALLKKESIVVKNGKIVDFENILFEF